MGCDIHCWTEVRRAGRWECEGEGPFSDRSYATFSVLADVRNYDGIPPIAERRGWPDDCSPELDTEREYIEHSASWLTLAELLAYDTTRTFENRAFIWRDADGRMLGSSRGYKLPGAGEPLHRYDDPEAPGERVGMRTVAEEVEPGWSEALATLSALGAPEDVRIVFYFDS